MRILPTSGGEILYKGQKINGKISRQLDQQVIKEIQIIFQDPQSSLNERAKVSYIVGEGLQNVRPDLTAAQREEKVRQALLDVGLLPEFASRFPHEFSGGQRQRIGIARALIVDCLLYTSRTALGAAERLHRKGAVRPCQPGQKLPHDHPRAQDP